MAITILPRETSTASEIAGGLGQGIGSGIQALANMKMQEYANKQLIKQQQEAQEYQYQQQEKALEAANLGQYKPYVRMPGGIQMMRALMLGGYNPPAAGQPGQEAPGIAQTMAGLQNPDQYAGAENYLGLGQTKQMPSIASVLNQNLPGAQQNVQPGTTGQPQQEAAAMGGIKPTGDIATALRQGAMNKPEIIARQQEGEKNRQISRDKLALQQGEAAANRAERIDKKSDPYYNEVTTKADAATKDLMLLESQEAAVKSGELPDPDFVKFAEGLTQTSLGKFINFNTLIGPKGEKYNKELMEFLTGMKAVFGARIAVADMNNYLKKFAGLTNTTEGKLEILHDLITIKHMEIEKGKIARQLYEENDYMKPKGFEAMVEKRWAPIRDKYAEEFRQNAIYGLGSGLDELPDPKNFPPNKDLVADNGQRLRVINGEWRVVK